jgi:septal ring factor EnvC (AmiA/AmiB activator)
MNQFYVLTEKAQNGRETESIITQELLDSLMPLPESTMVCKFISDAHHQTMMKQAVDEVEGRLRQTTQEWRHSNDEWRKQQTDNAELRQRVAELEEQRHEEKKRVKELEERLSNLQLAMATKKRVWRLNVTPYQQGTYPLYFDSAELMREYCEKLSKADAVIRGPDTDHMALHTHGWEIKIITEVKE